MRGWSDLTSSDLSPVNQLSAERELLVAILDRAVLDYTGRDGELHEKAKDWLFGKDDPDNLFSFESICYFLRINPSALRDRIKIIKIPKNVAQAHRWLRRKVQSERVIN